MREAVVRTVDLTKKFGNFTATDRLSIEVYKGEIFGFLGANGAGKTTAMRMLCGLLLPSSGTATVAGYSVYNQADQIKRNIGYMSQKFSMYEDLTIRENILFYGGVYGMKRKVLKQKTEEILEKYKLQDFSKTVLRELPLGWKQKLSFSLALIHEPDIVFLDEPTGGVDPITRRQFWELIYEAAHHGTTIFVTTHYMDEAEYCDRVSIMVDGQVKALDAPKQLKAQFGTDSMDGVFQILARWTSTRG